MSKLTRIILGVTTASLIADLAFPYFFGNSLRSYIGLESERSSFNNIITTMEQISLVPLAFYYAILYSNSKKKEIV